MPWASTTSRPALSSSVTGTRPSISGSRPTLADVTRARSRSSPSDVADIAGASALSMVPAAAAPADGGPPEAAPAGAPSAGTGDVGAVEEVGGDADAAGAAADSGGTGISANRPIGVRTSGRPASSRPRRTTGRAIRPTVPSVGRRWVSAMPRAMAVRLATSAAPAGPERDNTSPRTDLPPVASVSPPPTGARWRGSPCAGSSVCCGAGCWVLMIWSGGRCAGAAAPGPLLPAPPALAPPSPPVRGPDGS